MRLNFPRLHLRAQRASFVLVVFLLSLFVVAFDLDFWSSHAAPQSPTQVASKAKNRTPTFVPGEILVRFRDSSEVSKSTAAVGARRSFAIVARGRTINLQIERLDKSREIVSGLRFARVAPEDTLPAIESLNSRSDVLYAEPNYIRVKQVTPNDPRYVDMWNLKNTSGLGFGVAGADIKAEQAWEVTKGSRNVVVAVIDEGIDVSHPDLQPNLWTNPAEVPGNGLDDDSNGFIDDVNGFDFVHNDGSVYDGPGTNPDGSIIDEHGTHVAGTIGAAGNNAVGVVGVNWEVSLMSLKFLGPTGGTTADALKAFSYAKMMRELWISSSGTKGANLRITNNSYGSPGFSQAEADGVQTLSDAGILFVAAAGNDALDNNQIGHYPASYDVPNIISVAATDRFDRLSTFSNYGSNSVHIGAPGTAILSTVPGGNYGVKQGTSMASPHVAGAAALILTQHPEFSVSRLRAALIFGGTEIASMFGVVETGNRLDAAAALQNATDNDPTPPAPISDLQVISSVGRSVTLRWTSPGDDGSSGRAALTEMRFIDQSTGQKYFVGTAKPATAGTQQVATVNIPYQHTNGSLELRVVDNAGNTSVATVTVQINPEAASPYEITETAAEPLSTGGTLVTSNFDDFITDFTLPFVFPYFESNIESLFAQGSTSSVFYSTNGTLYFARSARPGDDAFSTPIFLPGWRMIAGLWDDLDLRTSSRADAGVFVVTPDANRVIFRWQGVPCNTNLNTGLCQGGEQVNFEIELRSDGTIIKRYGSGNTDLLPVVGISAGEFDPYVVPSHTASSSNISLTNAPTITYRLRNPPKKADLKFTASDISPTPVLVGTDATIKLTVANVGPDQGAGARVVGTVPSNLLVTSCTSSVGTCWFSPGASDTKVMVELAAFQPNSQINLDIGIRLVSATDTNRFFQVGTTWSVSSFTFDPDSNFNVRSVNFSGLNPNPNPLTNALFVGAGSEHALAITPGGNLLSWGQNAASQLGTDGISRRTRPDQVEGITNVFQVGGGFGHSIALTIDGRVWTWGGNSDGQLGDGTTLLRKTPQPINGLTGVTAISAGGGHNLALLNNGTVWAWGANGSGRLGDGTTTTRLVPVQVSGLTSVVAIAAGKDHSLAVKSDGTVWAWGSNESGKLGDGSEISRSSPVQVVGLSGITSVSAGGGNSYALDGNGRVWSWGTNFNGEVGDGTIIKRVTPVQIPTLTNVTRVAAGTSHCLALRSDGTVWSWGNNFRGALGQSLLAESLLIPGKVLWISNITSLAAGQNLSLARSSDGKLFSWGEGGWGQLGDGDESSRGFPFEVSAPPAPPQQPPPIGTLIAPTFSPDGGSFGSTQNVTIRSASADAVFKAVAFGWQHSLFLMTDGTVWGAGTNGSGQLGDGTTTSSLVLVQTRISDVIEVSAGASHSLALKSDGTVWAWGADGQGQLGIGGQQNAKTSPVKVESLSGVVSISAGSDASLALKSDGTVWTWGWNDQGQLGNGTQTNSNVPIQVQSLSGVTFATTGLKHTLALKSDGTVWTWGANDSRQLGDGTTAFRRLTPVQVVGLTNVTAASTTGDTGAAIRNDGTVWTWGANSEGQLGIGQTGPNQASPVQATALSNPANLSMGAYHGLVRSADGTVRAWGSSFAGQIGNGGTTSQPSPIQVATGSISIAAKNSASSMFKSDGLWVWGLNGNGQLGVGSTGDKLSPVKVNPVTTGVTIHYTTNGLDPTETDPIIASGASVVINQTTTLKARAFKNGWAPSPIKTATFTIAGAPTIQLGQPSYVVGESDVNFNVSVTRSGDISNAASVNYATTDTAGGNNCNVSGGQASSRCDYLNSIGKLTFGPGEVTKTIVIPVVDDVYVEGAETFSITLSNAVGANLSSPSSATLTINDNDSSSNANPIDVGSFFVRQHYIDFLNREPDPEGLAFWTNQITSCDLDLKCIEIKRINVSAAFFLSIEFQETGYFVYRAYKSGLGNLTNPSGAPVPVRFIDFLRDTQEVGRDVQVGIGDWQGKVEANKQAYILAFVQRPDFQAQFPNSLTADQVVSRLNANAGGVLSESEKSDLISQLNANPTSDSLRAQALRSVIENQTLKDAEKNRAFVLMQYFGYMRRNPFDPPDADFAGYNFWLGKLNEFNGNFINAEMVKAFLVSMEYRQRFGP